MKCPRCESRIFPFLVWGSLGTGVFQAIDCPHCGAALRVSAKLIWSLLLAVLVCMALFVGILVTLYWLEIPFPRAIVGLVALPLAIACTYPVWKYGRYRLRASDTPLPDPAITPSIGKFRWLFVVGICLMLIVLLVTNSQRDLLLSLNSRSVFGQVVGVEQLDGNRFRKGDHEVTYLFADDQEVVHFGKDKVPSAKPIPQGRVEIVYRPGDPSISRLASQRTSTALGGIVMGAGTILWVTWKYIRERRRLRVARREPSGRLSPGGP